MVSAINFAVRSAAGGNNFGTVAGDGQSNFIQVGVGDSVSLNISSMSVVSFEHQGRDLVITLSDGRIVVLAGYYDGGIADNHLYLSSDAQITEVFLPATPDGVMAVNYGPAQPWDKWSPLDDLRFTQPDMVADAGPIVDEPAGMGPFIPALLGGLGGLGSAGAAGLVGLGVIGGGLGGGGGGGTVTRAVPTVDNPGAKTVITTNTANPTIPVSGTGEPGDTVKVTVGGHTETTTIGTDGKWNVVFSGGNLPTDGNYSSVVVVTQPNGTNTTLDGPDAVIDLTPPAITVTEGTQGAGDIENLLDYQDGVTIAGTGEPGAAISVVIGSVTHTTTVTTGGNWSVNFTQTEVAGGERSTGVTITATDALGNKTVVTDTLVLDTVPHPITISPVTADNIVSQADLNAGFAVSGTTTPGATVKVELGTITRTVTAGADGSWSTIFAPGSIPGGTYSSSVTASTVDGAGNTSSTSRSFNIDTEVTVAFDANPIAGDNIVNMLESTGSVTMTGTSQAGSSVSIDWGGVVRTATVAPDGRWTVTFPGSQVPADGTTTAIARAVDNVGNTSSASRSILVDTSTQVTLNSPVTADDRISGSERSNGFAVTGTAEAGATISVNIDGAIRTTTADQFGRWTANFLGGDLRSGVYQASMIVTATDVAGNTATTSRMIAVDTQTSVTINAGQAGGDNLISGAERTAGVTLTGTAEPGATVEVSFHGTTRTVTAGANGQWAATFATAEIPAGTSSSSVLVRATDAFGNTATANHTLNIDTEVAPLTRSSISYGADAVVNQTEAASGLVVTGTVEPGSTVTVTFASGATRTATVAANGQWTVTIPTQDIPAGETQATMVIRATDAVGNTHSLTETVQVDRSVMNFAPANAKLAGDGFLNAEEAAQGLVVNGTAEPGATIVVHIDGGGTLTTVAGANGLWTTTFIGATLPSGELNTTVTVTATDRAGNVSSYSQPLTIDTIAPGAPDVETFTRNAVGLTRIETSELNETYTFTQIDSAGHSTHINAITSPDMLFGTQNVSFGQIGAGGGFVSTPVPDGSYLVINTTDVAGNESSTLLIVNNTNAPDVDLSRAGLSNFDFSAIDLTFAPEADLSITESQLLAITGPDKTLLIKGDVDDHVSVIGGVNTGLTQDVDGETFNIYTVGNSGARLLLDDDITVV